MRLQVSGVRCQRRRWKKTAGLIKKETNEHRTSNVQHLIMTERSDTTNLQSSIFNSDLSGFGIDSIEGERG
jgi:hypothetical protein